MCTVKPSVARPTAVTITSGAEGRQLLGGGRFCQELSAIHIALCYCACLEAVGLLVSVKVTSERDAAYTA